MQQKASSRVDIPQDSDVQATTPPTASPQTKLYRAVWRWHFYAGLFVIPFSIILAVTGSIYLFRPYVEPMLYAHLYNVPPQPTSLPYEEQIAVVRQTFPEAQITHITPVHTAGSSTEVTLRDPDNGGMYAYVDPHNGEFLGSLVRDDMFMQRVRMIHGELLLGNFGEGIVELVACWAIVLLISGIYLWWPRPKFTVWGVFVPRVGRGRRLFWRDMHAVVAMYASIGILGLIMTGLPWSGVWGAGLSQAQQVTGQSRPAEANNAMFQSAIVDGANPLALADVVAVAEANNMRDYTIQLPPDDQGVFTISMQPTNPANTQIVHVDQYSGNIVGRVGWADYPLVAQSVTMGIRLHQGEYFGIPNLLLVLLTALCMIWMSFTGFVMWWQRRPKGALGVPKAPRDLAIPRGIFVITIILGILFPLVGASLIILFVLDRFVFIKIPWMQPVRGY